MIQFFARVVELREEKTVIYDGKITADLPSRGFLEVPSKKGGSYTQCFSKLSKREFLSIAVGFSSFVFSI